MRPRNLTLLLAFPLAFPLACAGLSVSARSPFAALPPLPRSAPTALGAIRIDRVPGPFPCGEVKEAMGCIHYEAWRIEVMDSLPLPIAWQVLYHELAHAALKESGVEFDDDAQEDRVVEAIANQRVLHMRAGFPKR